VSWVRKKKKGTDVDEAPQVMTATSLAMSRSSARSSKKQGKKKKKKQTGGAAQP
jgi:hypothetical protein